MKLNRNAPDAPALSDVEIAKAFELIGVRPGYPAPQGAAAVPTPQPAQPEEFIVVLSNTSNPIRLPGGSYA